MSIVQFWWQFDGEEFASRVSHLVCDDNSQFAENCVACAGQLVKDTTGWEEKISNVGGWDQKSITADFADPNSDSLDLAVLVLVLASCKQKVAATDLKRCSIRVPLSSLVPDAVEILNNWSPPSTASSSAVVPNDGLIRWLQSEVEHAAPIILQTANEGYDLLCISSG